MDSIYLDRPCDKLDLKKIRVLNEARRPLLEHDRIGTINLRVRTALAQGLRVIDAQQVLEWGCGYHPMNELLGASGYSGTDIDPDVIAHNRRRYPEASWHEADRNLLGIESGTQDAIVSAFVFHFRLSRLHIYTMRRVLKPTGVVLANVYRRSPGSRRDLVNMFESAGLRVHREKDTHRLCVDHEFWCLTRNDQPETGIAKRIFAELTASIGSMNGRLEHVKIP